MRSCLLSLVIFHILSHQKNYSDGPVSIQSDNKTHGKGSSAAKVLIRLNKIWRMLYCKHNYSYISYKRFLIDNEIFLVFKILCFVAFWNVSQCTQPPKHFWLKPCGHGTLENYCWLWVQIEKYFQRKLYLLFVQYLSRCYIPLSNYTNT